MHPTPQHCSDQLVLEAQFTQVISSRQSSCFETCRARQHICVASNSATASDADLVDSSGFRIEQISFGKILSPIGIGLMSYGFGAFFGLLPGGDISSIMLIYGFPISLLGFALAYAQLKPVPCKTTRAAFNLRDTQMTDIQKQVHLSQACSNNRSLINMTTGMLVFIGKRI